MRHRWGKKESWVWRGGNEQLVGKNPSTKDDKKNEAGFALMTRTQEYWGPNNPNVFLNNKYIHTRWSPKLKFLILYVLNCKKHSFYKSHQTKRSEKRLNKYLLKTTTHQSSPYIFSEVAKPLRRHGNNPVIPSQQHILAGKTKLWSINIDSNTVQTYSHWKVKQLTHILIIPTFNQSDY